MLLPTEELMAMIGFKFPYLVFINFNGIDRNVELVEHLIRLSHDIFIFMILSITKITEGLGKNCDNKELNSQLYCNRAAAQFSIGNYRYRY